MTARPYDIVAYSPAASNVLRRTSRSSCMPARRRPGLRPRDGGDRVAGLRRLRPDEVDLPARLVLRHDEREDRLPGLAEREDAAREDRVLHLQRGEGRADGIGLQRPRLRDSGEERASGLVRRGVVPLRGGAGRRLVLRGPGFYLRIREEVGPPAARENVVGGRAEPLAPRLIGTAGAVGEHLVVEPHLRVGPLHRDEVLEVGVAHEKVRLGGPDPVEDFISMQRAYTQMGLYH